MASKKKKVKCLITISPFAYLSHKPCLWPSSSQTGSHERGAFSRSNCGQTWGVLSPLLTPPHKASPFKLRHPLTEGGHPVAPGDLQLQWGKARCWPCFILGSSCWPPGRNRTLDAEGSTFMRDYPGLDPFLIPNTGSLAQNEDGGSFLPVSLCLKWYHFSNGKKKKKKTKTKPNTSLVSWSQRKRPLRVETWEVSLLSGRGKTALQWRVHQTSPHKQPSKELSKSTNSVAVFQKKKNAPKDKRIKHSTVKNHNAQPSVKINKLRSWKMYFKN